MSPDPIALSDAYQAAKNTLETTEKLFNQRRLILAKAPTTNLFIGYETEDGRRYTVPIDNDLFKDFVATYADECNNRIGDLQEAVILAIEDLNGLVEQQ